MLVATELDLEGERVVSCKEGEMLAMKMGVGYMETSSKAGDGVA